jgi:hypothetical protein
LPSFFLPRSEIPENDNEKSLFGFPSLKAFFCFSVEREESVTQRFKLPEFS